MVGILALQGAFAKHAEALAALGAPHRLVRQPDDLEGVDRLILPGGESTTLSRHLERDAWFDRLRRFAADHPMMGTCAGLILLSGKLLSADSRVRPLGVLDVTVDRNAYGRQSGSFATDLAVADWPHTEPFPGVFIRAPRIVATGQQVAVMARHDGWPVAVRQNRWLGLTFHPELTKDRRFHRTFLAIG